MVMTDTRVPVEDDAQLSEALGALLVALVDQATCKVGWMAPIVGLG